MTCVTDSESATREVARALAASLQPGAVLLLSGTLGAGKTAFVRGLAEGLGIDPAEVSSPTFTLIHEYRGGRLDLYHADLYRLERTAPEELGLDEIAGRGGVLAIEWPERLSHPLRAARAIRFEILPDDRRRIAVEDAIPSDNSALPS